MTLWGRVRGWARAVTATFDAASRYFGEFSPVPSSTLYTFDTPARPLDAVIGEMLGVIAGSVPPRVGRDEALSVPAVLKGRNMITSIATLPIIQRGPNNLVVTNNPLFRQLDRDVPNVVTLAQTVEDLLFEGIAWWRITGIGSDRFPTDIQHVPTSSVSLNPPKGITRAQMPLPSGIDPHEPVVWVDGKEVSGSQMIRFDSPNPPLLKAGARAIRRALLLDSAAGMYADDPTFREYFTPADGADPIDDDEVDEILRKWRWMRKRRTTGWIPASMKHNTVDMPNPRDLQLVELQRQASLDIANALGIDPEDLGISTTSRTYQNATDRRQDRINEVLSPYMRAITDRLSMGDVTPRGHLVAFVLDDYMKADATTRWDMYGKEHDMFGDAVLPEIREREGLPPLAVTPEPAQRDTASMMDQAPRDTLDELRKRRELAASLTPAFTFGRPDGLTVVDVPVTGFSVDRERRIIEGTIMPYGAVGTKYGMRIRFAKGALKWTEASRVKLNLLHDGAQSVGYAASLTQLGPKLHARFKVGRGSDGDRALALAEDKIMDGFSVGVDFDENTDAIPDPNDTTGTGLLVQRADLRHVALTPEPVFDDARVTKVAASRTGRNVMDPDEETTETETAPASAPAGLTLTQEQARLLLTRPGALETLLRQQAPTPPPDGLTLSAEQIDSLIQSGGLRTLLGVPAPAGNGSPGPTRVDPTRRTASTTVEELAPYRFDRKGNLGRGSHDFSSDLFAAFRDGDRAAYDRALSFVRAEFDVVTTNVAGVNPNLQRPDLYVDQRDFRYPIWDSINKGTLTEVTPFVFPKFNTASGLVGAHTQGTEPSSGAFTVTTQTVTPTAMSGKAKISREVFDAGGNPQVSDLIWRQMTRGWFEALEAAAVAELDAATPASLATFTVGGGTNKQTLVAEMEAALAALQFVRGGFTMTDLYTQIDLYMALVAAKDSNLRPYYASVGQQNARGSVESRFGALDVNGVTAYPTWALAASGIVPASSYLFDRASVHGWASAPNRLDINMTEVANVYLGVWGYKATAISDINGVREVIYDPV